MVEFHSVSNTLGVDHKLTLDGETPPDGRYTLNDDVTRFEVIKGLVTHEYFIETYEHNGSDIMVDCSRISGYGRSCHIYKEDEPLPDGVYKLKRFKWVKVVDGVIVQTGLFKIAT
ncbi:hypothetical protein [Neolewinella persica]|uniref:hypothetical protein n=1 Tax=Neolewinella persica TaxID=70998 RepID=UPI001B7FDDE8|nr:hypothetical protein [Neolewinella persica]